ncbi:MAG TPA: hypothetical protein VII28_05935, partial [Puia sp.]
RTHPEGNPNKPAFSTEIFTFLRPYTSDHKFRRNPSAHFFCPVTSFVETRPHFLKKEILSIYFCFINNWQGAFHSGQPGGMDPGILSAVGVW